MGTILYYAVVTLLVVSGIGLLPLIYSGFVSLRQPYILRQPVAGQTAHAPVAFVDVNVAPMDGERILAHQTVVVRDGIIQQIGDSAALGAPPDAQIVDGRGRYLMPGLADMHVHIKEENELLLFVAHGVTTVREMWGTTGMQLSLGFPDQLALRAQIEAGELLGPAIYTAGPVLEGDPPTVPFMEVFRTPQEAAEAVAWQEAQGYDFVKVYDNLTAEVYAAILEVAQEHELTVMGHTPKQVGLDRVLTGGQRTIEHLTGYLDPDTADFLIPEDQFDRYAVLTREAGVWNCPTFAVYQMYVPDEELPALEARPEMAYVSPRMKIIWKYMSRPGAMQNTRYQGDYPRRIDEIYTRMVRTLHDNGAGIVLGTDTDNPYLVPGPSLLDELDYLVQAGFSPYEAIAAGTRNAAEAMDRLDEFGTVAEGKRADLILLAANPFEDVRNVRRQEGVMVRGRWLPKADIQVMLQELVDSYRPALWEQIWPLSLLLVGVLAIARRSVGRRDRRSE